jgi:uncharacterized SAM-binding protein YcdF (DUF218 family)
VCKLHVPRTTLKAFANSSPGLPQPWDRCNQRIVTLKALANGCECHLASSFRVREVVWVGTGIPGLKQPWAGISQRFQRTFSLTVVCLDPLQGTQQKKSRRKQRWLIVLAVLVCAWPLFAWAAAKLLIVKAPLEHADAIVLLSGSTSYKERAQLAAQLFSEGRAPKIILTNDGQRGSWSTTQQRNPFYYESTMAELIRLGIPKERIDVLLQPVSGTYGEATVLRKHLEGQGIRMMLVVTSAYHSRRALWTYYRVFDKTGIQIGLEAAQTGWQTPSPATWWLHLRGWQIVPAEYLKLIYYRWRFH